MCAVTVQACMRHFLAVKRVLALNPNAARHRRRSPPEGHFVCGTRLCFGNGCYMDKRKVVATMPLVSFAVFGNPHAFSSGIHIWPASHSLMSDSDNLSILVANRQPDASQIVAIASQAHLQLRH